MCAAPFVPAGVGLRPGLPATAVPETGRRAVMLSFRAKVGPPSDALVRTCSTLSRRKASDDRILLLLQRAG